MEEAVVTRVWMLEVVALMVAYGICALIGLNRKKKREDIQQ